MKEIQLTYELKRFQEHLKDNPRTILSSAFGNGKTTFIRQFLEQYDSQGEFIILHPVNYSCGSNEDVFEYVKRDILYHLATRNLLANVDFDAIDASLFSWDNIKELIDFLLSLAPAGEAFKTLWNKMIPWVERAKRTKDDYDNLQVSWEKYRTTFENQRGGIYEHDLYTRLIEETLRNIHERKNEKTHSTLIIEDMDRIDPAHLFRILNVLGAHLDEGSSPGNKFGFKNIILVMDYQTTEHIFHHFYGERANYHGYMKKFISHHVYNFSIVEAAKAELFIQLYEKCSLVEKEIRSLPVQQDGSYNVLTLGQLIDRLCVREIAQILDDLDNQIYEEPLSSKLYTIRTAAPITYLLAVLVRLNRAIDYNVLFDYILRERLILKLLQQYLLFDMFFASERPFLLNQEGWVVHTVNNSDGTTSVEIAGGMGSFQKGDDVKSKLRLCFDHAMLHVKDCRHIVYNNM